MDFISWRAHLKGWTKWHVLVPGPKPALLCGNPLPPTNARISTRDQVPPEELWCGACLEKAHATAKAS